MQKPNVVAYRTVSSGVRASRILLFLGVFAAVPAAGHLPGVDGRAETPVFTQTTTGPVAPAVTGAADSAWAGEFDDSIERLWKWWMCAACGPDETPEQRMDRLRECYRLMGLPDDLPPDERDAINHAIDDLLAITEKAPSSVDRTTLSLFRQTLLEIRSKLG